MHGVGTVREAPEVKAHGRRHIDKEPVAPAADNEREILVGEVGTRAVRVPVPDPHRPAHEIEAAESLAASVEVILGIEEQRVDDTTNTTGRIVGEAVDLEPRPGAESMAGKVRVVLHLMGQEMAVARPEGELPWIEACLDDHVLRAEGEASRGRAARPRS